MTIVFVITMMVLLNTTAFGMTDNKAVASATKGLAALALQSNEEKYALHQAARQGNYAECKKLIEAKAPVDLQNGKHKNTPLHLAAHFNHPNTCKLLTDVGKASIDIKNALGYTPLRVAYESNADQAFWVLIQRGAKTDELEGLQKLTMTVTPITKAERSRDVLISYRIYFSHVSAYDQVPVQTRCYAPSNLFDEKGYIKERRIGDDDDGMYMPKTAVRVYKGESIDIQAMLKEELGCMKDADRLAKKAAEDLARFAKESVDQER